MSEQMAMSMLEMHEARPSARLSSGGVRPCSAAARRAARRSLRSQIARLEQRLSELVAAGFPRVAASRPERSAKAAAGSAGADRRAVPRMLSVEELERRRDWLVTQVWEAEQERELIAERERQACRLLQRMREEPRAYKFARLPVTELGGRGCGVWQVRPRLGLIGMLAGWWELKLSSGCPLGWGRSPVRWQAGGRSTGRARRRRTAGPASKRDFFRCAPSRVLHCLTCLLRVSSRLASTPRSWIVWSDVAHVPA